MFFNGFCFKAAFFIGYVVVKSSSLWGFLSFASTKNLKTAWKKIGPRLLNSVSSIHDTKTDWNTVDGRNEQILQDLWCSTPYWNSCVVGKYHGWSTYPRNKALWSRHINIMVSPYCSMTHRVPWAKAPCVHKSTIGFTWSHYQMQLVAPFLIATRLRSR